jgi:Fe-S cluster assembly protein SufD
MSATLATRIAEEFAAASRVSATNAPASGGTQHQASERQGAAAKALAERGLPTSRDENWKYVNLRPLEKVRFAPAPTANRPAIQVSDLPAKIEGYARYTFVDGVYAPELSATAVHTGVSVSTLTSTSRASSNGAVAANAASGAPTTAVRDATDISPDLRFALLNEAFATDGADITVAPGTDCQACIELIFVATADAKVGSSYPRVDFRVGAGARVGLIERHMSFGSDSNFINCAVAVDVARDASVQHYRVQQTGPKAIWFDTLNANLATNARYGLHSVNLGALSARSTVRVQLTGERAEVAFHGASLGGKNQVHDTYAVIEHIAPNARTSQDFRGIAAGRARVAFNGKIIVHKGAHGTDSSQSLRGLLAGPDAEIDVRPQLEIYTDDVRCNHGATAGKLDDNMLFYLLSRGLDRETALRLLKWAFLEDVVAKIDVPELRRQIEQSLAGQLDDTAVLKELL